MKVWTYIWANDNIMFVKWSPNDVHFPPPCPRAVDIYDCFDKEIITYLLTNYLLNKKPHVWASIEI